MTGEKSVLDRSLGLDERCLSARALITVLYNGATGDAFSHLTGCATCSENLYNLASVPLESAANFVEAAYAAAMAGERSVGASEPVREGTKVVAGILHAADKVVPVVAGAEREVTLRFDLIPAFPRSWLKAIDPGSLRIEGALTSDKVVATAVDTGVDGTPSYLSIAVSEGTFVQKAPADACRTRPGQRRRAPFCSISEPGAGHSRRADARGIREVIQ